MQLKNKNNRTWIEISENALLSNVSAIRKKINGKKIMAVVKSNAYGHGLEETVPILKNKVDWFAVDNINESLEIRKLQIKTPILVLGYSPISQIEKILNKNISITVCNKETLKKIASLKPKTKVKVHLKIETGMNRQGIFVKDLLNFVSFIKKNERYLFLEGIYSHFSDAKRKDGKEYTNKQLSEFEKIQNLVGVPLRHTAATHATFLYPDSHFDMVRTGIGLYGLWPESLAPVLSWKSVVAQVKEVEKGEFVGYERTWKAKKKTKIAVIPVGYYDGFDRGLSNKGGVLIKGEFASVIGLVSMNMITVDVSGIKNVHLEDEVVIIGRQGKEEIKAGELAKILGTTYYEVVSRINPLLPRTVV